VSDLAPAVEQAIIATHAPVDEVTSDPTPAIIKRNTLLLALSQAFSGSSVNFVFALGPLMVIALTGSVALAGVVVAIHGASRFVAAYPLGRITDRYGRRIGLVLALIVAAIGTTIVGFGANAGSVVGFFVGLFIFGIGMNGVNQMRLAAAEMYPPHRRAVMIGWLLTGSLTGIVVSPALVSLAGDLAPRLSFDPLALPWLFVPALLLPGLILVCLVRPDPKDIGADLTRYFPHYRPTPAELALEPGAFGPRRFFADPKRRLAALAMFSAQGSMQIAMVTAPLAMSHHGAALPAITLSLALHAAAMFGMSVPMGKLTDRVGRLRVLFAGTIVEAVGGGITAFASDQSLITAGVVLVGLGWCAANVSSTAIIVDSTHASARGAAIGLTDTVGAAGGILFPLCVGPLVHISGVGATGVLAVILMAPPAIVLLRSRRTWLNALGG
jgi:MFS family permease